MNGKIIKIISNLYTVNTRDGNKDCQARGKFRNDKITPLVGDNCVIDSDNNYILEIKERKNMLNRPPVANIDIAVILTSVKKPDLSLNLLDKMLSIITINKITPIICFSKLDLLSSKEKKDLKKLKKYYEKIGIKVVDNQKVTKIIKLLKGKVSVITGQTGAGKSSLLNKIDKSLQLKTGEISEALNRGKHTTRHVELYSVKGCFIVDTPGFSALDLNLYDEKQIQDSFREFNNYGCEYADCRHLKEKNCQVKKAVEEGKILPSRYANYVSFINKNK